MIHSKTILMKFVFHFFGLMSKQFSKNRPRFPPTILKITTPFITTLDHYFPELLSSLLTESCFCKIHQTEKRFSAEIIIENLQNLFLQLNDDNS